MKVFAMSDLHGQGELFDKAIVWMEKDSCGDYLCYFLGDAIDRGPDGWRIMNYLLEHSDKFVYLKGNHEDLFVKAMQEYFTICDEEGCSPTEFAAHDEIADIMFSGSDLMLHYYNGGASTFEAWIKAGCPHKYIKLLSELPIFEELAICDNNSDIPTRCYDFCHAGCKIDEWNDNDEQAAMWSREHFFQPWSIEDDIPHTLIHGHTPVAHMPKYFRKANELSTTKALRYNNNTKIDLDCACFHYGCLNLFDIGENIFRQFYTAEIEERMRMNS